MATVFDISAYDENDPLHNRSITPQRNPNLVRVEDGGHYHTDERGILHKCYHESKTLLRTWQFWFGVIIGNLIIGTIQFPLEHFLWEKVWGFRHVTHFLGL